MPHVKEEFIFEWELMDQITPDGDHFTSTVSTFNANPVQNIEFEFGTKDVTSYTTYTPEGETTYDEFNTFMIKIVCFADNPATPPLLKDFRAVAIY